MALRTTHIVVSEALISSYLWLTKQPPEIDIVSILGIWVGVQLPDLDSPKTKISRSLGLLGKIIGHGLGHRTWTHTLWAVIAMFMLANWLPVPKALAPADQNGVRWLYLSIAGGYFLHVLEDSFSYQGVCWLYPFQRFSRSKAGHRYRKRKWHWFYYRTGGHEEQIIRWGASIIMLYLFFKLLMRGIK